MQFPRIFAASCVLLASVTHGVTIQNCDSDGTTTAEEDSQDLVLACQGLDMTKNSSWYAQQRLAPQGSNGVILISTCSYSNIILPSTVSPWQCSTPYSTMIRASINEFNKRTHMIIPDVVRGGLADGSWSCYNEGSASALCTIDVVHTPRNVSCKVTIDEAQGLVSGECQTSRMFSSRNRYTAKWFERIGNEDEVEIPATDVKRTLMNCSDGPIEYYCGKFTFTKSSPLPTTSFGYRVVIYPGKISPSIDYTFVAAQIPSSSGTTNNGVTSPTFMTSSGKPTAVDEDTKNNQLYEGIGIGAGVLIGLLLIIIILVFVIRHFRNHQKKEPAVPFSTGDYDHPEPRERNDNDCETGDPYARNSQYNDSDSGYSVIGSKGYIDAASCMGTASDIYPSSGKSNKGDNLSHDLLAETGKALEICPTYDSNNKGDKMPRGLPAVPVEADAVEASEQNDGTGDFGHLLEGEQSADQEKKSAKKDDNAQIEKADMKSAPIILPSGFQMKDADYMYWRNADIPLSQPL